MNEEILKFIKLEKVLNNKEYEKNIEVLEKILDQINLYINLIENLTIQINNSNEIFDDMLNNYKNKIFVRKVKDEVKFNNKMIKDNNKNIDLLNKEKDKILNFIKEINENKNKSKSFKFIKNKNK